MEGTTLLNQESLRTFGEKKNNRYLGILEADSLKLAEMKEKIVPQKNEKTYWNQALQ